MNKGHPTIPDPVPLSSAPTGSQVEFYRRPDGTFLMGLTIASGMTPRTQTRS